MAANNFLSVLLADDDSDDRMLFEDAVNEIQTNVNLQMVKDGEELMRYLLTSAVILPEILFLDLNMPIKDGFQCLEEIQQNKILHSIFIVTYSTTASHKEIDEVFFKGANVFIKKPNSFIDLKNVLGRIFSMDLREYRSAGLQEKFIYS